MTVSEVNMHTSFQFIHAATVPMEERGAFDKNVPLQQMVAQGLASGEARGPDDLDTEPPHWERVRRPGPTGLSAFVVSTSIPWCKQRTVFSHHSPWTHTLAVDSDIAETKSVAFQCILAGLWLALEKNLATADL